MPIGWIDTASESENEIADPRSTFPKEIDFNGTTQEIYNSLMEGILFQPHARNPTMPIERQPAVRFNQPTVSTSTWADATDDELSPDELMEVLHLDTSFPIQINTGINSPTISTMSEESGSIEIVGPPAKSPRNPMFHHIPKRIFKLKNSAGSLLSKDGIPFSQLSKHNYGKNFSNLSTGKSTNCNLPKTNFVKPTQFIYTV